MLVQRRPGAIATRTTDDVECTLFLMQQLKDVDVGLVKHCFERNLLLGKQEPRVCDLDKLFQGKSDGLQDRFSYLGECEEEYKASLRPE
jgi:hypothetical protein